jgi:hypothetical protein
MHPGCKYIHIGCDEVFGIASCHKCKTKLVEDGLESLFMDHVVPLLRYIRSLGVQPLIWHDMIEKYVWLWRAPPGISGSTINVGPLSGFR